MTAASPRDSVCSGIASLRSTQIFALLAELSGIEMQPADLENACLEAVTSEKVCFIAAGPERGERLAINQETTTHPSGGPCQRCSAERKRNETATETTRPCLSGRDKGAN